MLKEVYLRPRELVPTRKPRPPTEVAKPGFADIHAERAEVDGFSVEEAHQARLAKGWVGTKRIVSVKPFWNTAGNFIRGRFNHHLRTKPQLLWHRD
jgi:hypothetical protein